MKKVNRLITATIVLTTALTPLTVFGAPGDPGTPNTTTVVAGQDTNAATVAAAKAELTLGDTTQVTSDLTLPSGKGGLKITWSTSDATVVSDTGVITRAAYLTGDRTATLTATIRKGNVTDTKDFTITVKKLPETRQEAIYIANDALAAVPNADAITLDTLSDAQAKVKMAHDDITVAQNLGAVDADFVGLDRLAAADAKITVVTDKSALSIGFANGDSATAVKNNITLPTTGANGSTIAWATSNADIVATDGTVTRPAIGAGDATVTLTATITKGNATETKAFDLTVDEREAVHVQLLSINDLHGKIDQTYQEDINNDGVKENLGRMDYMQAYLKQYEALNPNTIVLHDGDATGGSAPVSALFNDEPTVNVLNAMGVQLGTVGNHEFDRGTQELLRLINGGDSPKGFPGYQGMNYPLIAANVVYKDSGKLVLPAYQIQEVGGVKIGFIGVVTQSAQGMVMPAGIQDIQFTDETKAVNDAAAELKAQGVHAIIVLAHMDATQSGSTITGQAADLAVNGDPDIDVILAAHNHKVVNGTVNGKLIMQAYEYGKAFGDVNLDIDPVTDDIVGKSANVVYNDQGKVKPDADVSALIQKYEDLVAPKLNEVEGQAALPMLGGYTNTGDNALGNLIADSMKAAMHSDFAMVNGGGIRDNLNAGPITWNELFNILPFNNILESLEVKGSDMVTIINNQLSKYYGPDFSVAGLKYTYNLSSAKVENVYLPDGSKIDPNKTYTLTVNNFMATATAFKYAAMGNLGKNPVTGPEDLPALVDYVKNYQGPIAYQAEGRITPSNTLEVTNKAGATDTVYVNKLYPGDKVRVYASADATTPLAETTVASGQYYALITGLDLGANAGTAYIAVVSGGKTEGPKMPVNYSAE